jgi:hypothetical protein
MALKGFYTETLNQNQDFFRFSLQFANQILLALLLIIAALNYQTLSSDQRPLIKNKLVVDYRYSIILSNQIGGQPGNFSL